MSMTYYDWEKNLIQPRGKSQRKREEVQCKLGRHRVAEGVRTVWLKNPMGLSCVPCLQERGLEVPPEPSATAPKARRVPRPRRFGVQPAARVVPAEPVDPDAWRADPTHPRHGKKWTYNYWKCRCQPCITAGTRATEERRKRQRARRRSGLEAAA